MELQAAEWRQAAVERQADWRQIAWRQPCGQRAQAVAEKTVSTGRRADAEREQRGAAQAPR
jgi:hypothetical protein